jgi:hypothetical protein
VGLVPSGSPDGFGHVPDPATRAGAPEPTTFRGVLAGDVAPGAMMADDDGR